MYPYNPDKSFLVTQLSVNANQFDDNSPVKNNEDSIIVWNTEFGVLQRVNPKTNQVLEEIPNGLVKRYKATVTQSGLVEPVATELENNLGTGTWKYNNTGDFSFILNGAFPDAKKVYVGLFPNVITGGGKFVVGISAVRISADEIQIKTIDNSIPGLANDLLLNTSLTIEVYP
jgi:hypothetical protein